MDRIARNRLRWRCRRGLLELDLVLERLLASAPTDEELRALGRLLELPDPELWEIASGRSERYDADLAQIVARLRAA